MLGINELKSQDDKGSDGGDGGSPAYHDHDDDHHHPFNEGSEEVEEGNPSAAQPSAADAKPSEEVPVDIKIDEAVGRKEDRSVVIERDLNSEENCVSKDVNAVDTKSAKDSDYENGNSGGSSNVETIAEKNLKDEAYSSIKETVTFDELVKSIDSSHAKMTSITEDASVEETGNSVVESSVDSVKPAGSISGVNSSGTGNALLEKPMASQVGATESAMKKNEDVRTSSSEEPKPREFDNQVLPPVSRSPFPESTNGTEHVKDSDTPECSENQVFHFFHLYV